MNERDTRDPLRDLGDRLEKARRERTDQRAGSARNGRTEDGRAGLALAFRIGLELMVAVILGVAIGWAFDTWLGTRPVGMILFFFLGVGAGMTNVYRAVTGMGKAVGYRRDGPGAAGKKEADRSDEEEDED